jgi:hypothetical protein
MRGRLRVAAQLCALGMTGVVLYVLWATIVGGSNIAPVLVFLALPPATLAVIVLWALHLTLRRRPDTRYL